MKTALKINFNQYEGLRHLLICQEEILSKKTILFSGIKSINPELIVVSFIHNRYLFRNDAEKSYEFYGQSRYFTFRLFELAALSYFLSDCAGLPDHLLQLNEEIKAIIKPFEYLKEKTAFQIWLEEKILTDWDICFTELRDQHPNIYRRYENEYNSEVKNKSPYDDEQDK
jgi:hypothetical protein